MVAAWMAARTTLLAMILMPSTHAIALLHKESEAEQSTPQAWPFRRKKHRPTRDGQVILDLGDGGGPIAVTLSSGRAVIQKRTSDSVDFFRGWSDYKSGFGDSENFWLGNDNIHRLTAALNGEADLRVDLADAGGQTRYAAYSTFHVDNESNSYRLTIGGYSGDAGDSLAGHNGRSFSTNDRDNDAYPSGNCANMYQGAWWYRDCHTSNLNGRYEGPGVVPSYGTGICWKSWRGYYYSMQSSEMSLPTLPSWTPSPTSSPTPSPTPSPTANPTPSPTPSPTPNSGDGASATGDPHLRNVRGERFDVMKAGKHALINIPRGISAENALLHVTADARQLGEGCADMYFQEVNVTGSWAEVKQAGGYHYSASTNDARTPEWITLGKVALKVVVAHAGTGILYLNIYVKHLGESGFAVGGLLGEDDHEDVAIPPRACRKRMSLQNKLRRGFKTPTEISEAIASFL